MKEGRKAPGFKLPDQDGNIVGLSDFVGRTVVLYFYPKAGTPGCTAQACGVRDRLDEYDAADAVVMGISRDDQATLREFADEHDLPFTLLSDSDHKVADKYGVWVEKSMYGRTYMGVQRATFVIGPDGKLQKAFPKITPKKHDELVLAALA
jgi:peroxiredoxin Q/BCP